MASLESSRLQRTTTAQQLAAVLLRRILAGSFTAGARLRESAIAAELGVARNTVREAVRLLELSGLVRYEVNRGAVVISPTPESVEAVYVARERLECAAVAKKPTADQLRRLDEAYRELSRASRTRDVQRIIDADLALHATLVSFLGSSRLDHFYADLMQELRFYLTVLSTENGEYDRPRAVLAEHKAIVEAVRNGPPRAAVAAVAAHTRDNRTRLMELMSRRLS